MKSTTNTTSKPRGLAALSPELRHEVASKAGKAAKNRHRWTSQEAVEAGRKGLATRQRKRGGFVEEL